MIGIFLRGVFLHGINSINNPEIWSIDIILSIIFFLLGVLIFCEVIILTFFDLNKFTRNKTSERAIYDSSIISKKYSIAINEI